MTMMRALALLVLATTLSAQHISPTEQSYGPYGRPHQGGRHALAVGSNGILLAWSEIIDGVARVRVGLLNSRGQLISEIATMPVTEERAEASAPAVSFNGQSFLVAWVERYRGEKMRSLVIDGSGTPIPPAQTHKFVEGEDVTPLITWDGAAWQLQEGHRGGVQASTFKNGIRASVSWKSTPLFTPCGIRLCSIRGYRWDVVWNAGAKSGSEQIGDEWPNSARPCCTANIAPAGDDFAIAWAANLAIGYRFTSSRSSEIVPDYVDDEVEPGLACDDERCLIAYGTWSGDVLGIVFDRDDPGSAERLTISATERTEHSPLVHHLGSGRFLVSYLSDQTRADQRINGRFVSFGPVRRRAVR